MKPRIPQNKSAEENAIGCLLLGAPRHAVPLREDHFAAPDHRLVFAAVCELAEENHPVNVHSVTSRLTAKGQLENAGGPVARFLTEGAIGGEAALKFYYPDLETARQSREAFLYVERHIADVASFQLPAPQFAEELSTKCAPLTSSEGSSAAHIIAEIEETWGRGEELEVFPTGLRPLDVALRGGFKRGELGVIAADTGKGKSALLIQAAAMNADSGRGVVYISLEMPRADVMFRIVSAMSGQAPPIRGFAESTLEGHAQSQSRDKAFRAAMCDALHLPLKIHDEITDLSGILGAIRSAARNENASLALVDYLQLIECSGDTREQAVSEIARKLKGLAAQEHIVVLTASQVNESGQLRESRAIGHHANTVLFIDDQSAQIDATDPRSIRPCLIHIGKFRRGPRATIDGVGLHGPTSRFIEV